MLVFLSSNPVTFVVVVLGRCCRPWSLLLPLVVLVSELSCYGSCSCCFLTLLSCGRCRCPRDARFAAAEHRACGGGASRRRRLLHRQCHRKGSNPAGKAPLSPPLMPLFASREPFVACYCFWRVLGCSCFRHPRTPLIAHSCLAWTFDCSLLPLGGILVARSCLWGHLIPHVLSLVGICSGLPTADDCFSFGNPNPGSEIGICICCVS